MYYCLLRWNRYSVIADLCQMWSGLSCCTQPVQKKKMEVYTRYHSKFKSNLSCQANGNFYTTGLILKIVWSLWKCIIHPLCNLLYKTGLEWSILTSQQKCGVFLPKWSRRERILSIQMLCCFNDPEFFIMESCKESQICGGFYILD